MSKDSVLRPRAGGSKLVDRPMPDGATLSPVAVMLESLQAMESRLARVPERFVEMPVRAICDGSLFGCIASMTRSVCAL